MIPYAFTWGGSQRMYYLAQSLIARGDKVDIFALRTSKYNTYGKEELPNVIFASEPTEEVAVPVRNDNSAHNNTGWFSSLAKTIAFKLDPVLFNEITPGNGLQAYKNFRWAKEKLKRQVEEEQYDIVIVSAPPFVVFSTMEVIKKARPNQKIVMDYRDPWNSWHTGNKLCERRERRLQKLADCIVCTNQALCDDMSEKYNIPSAKYHVVENGFMVEQGKAKQPLSIDLSHDKMNIVYTGSIGFCPQPDGYRDTIPLFDALDAIIKSGNKEIRLVFVGEANSDKEYLDGLRTSFGDNLLVVGRTDSSIAKEYVRQADACLLLHTAEDVSGKFLISGKAYDYIQERKYIFSVSRTDSQHAFLLRHYGIGINTPNTKEEITKGILSIYEIWKNDSFKNVYDGIDIMRFSRGYQLKEYARILDSL